LTHLILLAGLYRLARRAGMATGAAAVGAAAAGTCGVVWSSLTFTNVAASLAWSTWALGEAIPAPRVGRQAVRRALGGGCLLGLAFLAGEPITAGLAAAAFVAIGLWQWRGTRWALAACAGAAFAVAAPVLAPLVATYSGTARGALGVAHGALWADALAPRRLPELLLPGLLGPPLADAEGGFWAAASFPWQRYFPLLFVGCLPLLVVARNRFRSVSVWAVVAAWAVIVAGLAGSATVGALLGRLPAVSMVRFGIKLLVLPAIALAPLVGAGWQALADRWGEVGRGACRRVVVGATALAAIGLFPETAVRPVLTTLYPASRAALQQREGSTLRAGLLRDAALLALPAAVLILTGPSPTLAVVSACAANTLSGRDALPFDRAARWSRPPQLAGAVTPGTRLACFAEQARPLDDDTINAVLARTWRQRAALQPSYGVRWGLKYLLESGPDGLEPLRHELLATASSHLDLAARCRLAWALGADAVVAERSLPGLLCRHIDGVWLCRLSPSPRYYLARRVLPASDPEATLETMTAASFRPGEDVVEEGERGARTLAGGRVDERAGPPHHRRFSVSAAGPGLLVVQQSFASCWRARVDGAPARVEAVNGAATGIRVGTGKHEVELWIDLVPYRIGLLGPPLALLALIVTRRERPSRARRAPSDARGHSTPATGATSPP
jgi:hypothetical protein